MVDLVYVEEALEKLGIKYAVLAEHVKSGALVPPRVLDNRMVWIREEITAFINGLPRMTMPEKRGRGQPRGPNRKLRARRWRPDITE